MLRITLMGSSLGLAVPLGCWALNLIWNVTFGSWTVWIWPSSIFLLATDGGERGWAAVSIDAISVAANVLLYALVAFLLAVVFRKLRFKS
jgi:hypothetical protein